MNAIKNPFSPGAGSPPPEMVGREGTLDQARILLGRVKEKRPEKSILLTGLRGVGKTVLLNEIDRLPKPEKLAAAGRRRCEKFVHTQKLWRPQTASQRLEIFQNSRPVWLSYCERIL
jgi:hypothetical protein